MTFEAWITFATFWVLFVTTPGPNAVNCISTGMQVGAPRALLCVAGILTQAFLFLWGAALGVSALIVASPALFTALQLAGAGFLVFLGVRGWLTAHLPPKMPKRAGGIYVRAFLIATINAKSLAGYIAAFSQFVDPGVPILSQMWVIVPTALILTTASYTTYVMLGVWLGQKALGAVFNLRFRRGMALCFIGYGIGLGLLG